MTETIQTIDVRHYKVPLDEVLHDAKHGAHTYFDLITAVIETSEGRHGTGYTYAGGRGGSAIAAMARDDLAPMLIGRDPAPIEALNEEMDWHIHYVGRGGVAGFAIAAIDIALWDLRGQATGQSLAAMAGGHGSSCRAYCGGIDLGYTLEALLASVDGYLAQGAEAVKIKVGRPDLAEDVARVMAVRERLGPDRTFMVDANYALSVDAAIRAAEAFAPADLLWFEEPIIPEDVEGYAEIAAATGMPLAMGENLHTIHEVERALAVAKLSYLQPDASNCGGITGWLRAAERAEAAGVSVCSHGMQELHVSLLAGRQDPGWLEVHSFPIDRYTTRPLVLEDGRAIAPDTPGTGVRFDWDVLAPFRAS